MPERLPLTPGASADLKVEATFSDGSKRDVTWLCRFESNDAGQVEVDLAGKVRVRRHGETAVRASFQTGVAVAVVTAARPKAIDPKHFAVKNNVVDEHVFAKLAALRIEPSVGQGLTLSQWGSVVIFVAAVGIEIYLWCTMPSRWSGSATPPAAPSPSTAPPAAPVPQ